MGGWRAGGWEVVTLFPLFWDSGFHSQEGGRYMVGGSWGGRWEGVVGSGVVYHSDLMNVDSVRRCPIDTHPIDGRPINISQSGLSLG